VTDGGTWTVEGELLAANVVRLSWATSRDAERTSALFRGVGGGGRQRIRLGSTGRNSTLETVRLLNGITASCGGDANGREATVLMDCELADRNHNNVIIAAGALII